MEERTHAVVLIHASTGRVISRFLSHEEAADHLQNLQQKSQHFYAVINDPNLRLGCPGCWFPVNAVDVASKPLDPPLVHLAVIRDSEGPSTVKPIQNAVWMGGNQRKNSPRLGTKLSMRPIVVDETRLFLSRKRICGQR